MATSLRRNIICSICGKVLIKIGKHTVEFCKKKQHQQLLSFQPFSTDILQCSSTKSSSLVNFQLLKSLPQPDTQAVTINENDIKEITNDAEHIDRFNIFNK